MENKQLSSLILITNINVICVEVTKELDIYFGIFMWCFYVMYLALLHSPSERTFGSI
jgi:hypothetical protein